ncbi:MAG: hypothetical protein K6E98_09250, partial [Lachnospiraceae bacterium]|nr:hypothetical protein [Lachnospiraceae bacterium]
MSIYKMIIDRLNIICKKKITEIIFVCILLLYPLRHAMNGADFWDAGYNCANFMHPGIGHMSEVWYFSTYLSTLFGHMLTGFPCGDIFAGINIYTGLVISAGVI